MAQSLYRILSILTSGERADKNNKSEKGNYSRVLKKISNVVTKRAIGKSKNDSTVMKVKVTL